MTNQSMTAQEIFDVVARHLFDQGVPSYEAFRCLNRGPNNTKCAVGVLIPDDVMQSWNLLHNNDNMEFESLNSICINLGIFNQYRLLVDLREVHDHNTENFPNSNWFTTDTMRFALDAVAHEFNLDNSILATLKFKDR